MPTLIEAAQRARHSIEVSGGLRFLPIHGESGSGKSSAARELGTHLPDSAVLDLPRSAMSSLDELKAFMRQKQQENPAAQLLIAIIDQYEEAVATKGDLPSQFVEWLSLVDRDQTLTSRPWLFLWLTTSRDFQGSLEASTSRNRRILLDRSFQLHGPPRGEWVSIVEETFEAHNSGKSLPDFGIIPTEISSIATRQTTLGATIEETGLALAASIPKLQDLSVYRVVMLWPVTDGQKISTILRFVDAREGYRLDWNAWYRQSNEADRVQLPLSEFNRARLYFDVRLVPIAAADLHPLCRDLDNEDFVPGRSYVDRFAQTHYVSVVRGTWDSSKYAPLRERESQRAEEARAWYETATSAPTKIGRRIAKVLTMLGIPSQHERDIASRHATVRADVLSERPPNGEIQVITELKAFSPENTMPSTISNQVRITLKRHAQFGGFLQRQ